MPWTWNKCYCLFLWIRLLADVWHSLWIYTQLENTDEGKAEPNFLTIQTLLNRQHSFQKTHLLPSFIFTSGTERLNWRQNSEFPPVTTNSILKSCSVLFVLPFYFIFLFLGRLVHVWVAQSCCFLSLALGSGKDALTGYAAVGNPRHLSGS